MGISWCSWELITIDYSFQEWWCKEHYKMNVNLLGELCDQGMFYFLYGMYNKSWGGGKILILEVKILKSNLMKVKDKISRSSRK